MQNVILFVYCLILCSSMHIFCSAEVTTEIQKIGENGVAATVAHEKTVFDDGINRVDTRAFVSKTFDTNGPLTVGGIVDVTHLPTGSGLSVGAVHTEQEGTQVSAVARVNVWNNGANSRLDVVGGHGRQFGGPWGTSRSNSQVGVTFTHRF